MSYRLIEVDGVEYEYTIGKTFLKIKGIGSYNKWNSDIGGYSEGGPYILEEPAITPSIVKQLIECELNKRK